MATNPIPDGYHSATPFLVVGDATGAIDFYKQAFGATELSRLVDTDGKIAHAEIKIGDSPIMLSDEFPDWGALSPETVGGSPMRIHLYTEDVDALAARAVDLGAEVVIPINDQFYGDRSGRLIDPYGHTWIVATHTHDMSTEDMQAAFEEFLGQTG